MQIKATVVFDIPSKPQSNEHSELWENLWKYNPSISQIEDELRSLLEDEHRGIVEHTGVKSIQVEKVTE
jgi:hypothetical protein